MGTNTLFGFLWAGAGGFVGAGLRYLACAWIATAAGSTGYAWATFAVNIIGSFCIGWLSPFWLSMHHPARIFMIVGVLGGFTTFSSFSSDMLHLLQDGRWGWAMLYAGGSVVLGLLAAWGGFVLHSYMLK